MGKITSISYTTYTWSPWVGCEPVSTGCQNCWATELAKRFINDKNRPNWDVYGKGKARRLTKDWNAPVRWSRDAEGMAQRPRVFPSMCDWLDDQVPLDWLRSLLTTIVTCRNLNWLLLTKRPQNWEKRLLDILATEDETNHVTSQCVARNWLKGNYPDNAWFGITAENQAMMDERVHELVQIPAKVRWISVEPLLERIDLFAQVMRPRTNNVDVRELGEYHFDWVVVGGESGAKRRDCGVDAIVDVAKQCKASLLPTYVKQDCARFPGMQGRIPNEVWAWKEIPKA